jgi:hypothetical protein
MANGKAILSTTGIVPMINETRTLAEAILHRSSSPQRHLLISSHCNFDHATDMSLNLYSENPLTGYPHPSNIDPNLETTTKSIARVPVLRVNPRYLGSRTRRELTEEKKQRKKQTRRSNKASKNMRTNANVRATAKKRVTCITGSAGSGGLCVCS